MYDGYIRVLKSIQSKHDPFKRDPAYTGILEHVSQGQGEEYLALLRSEFNMTNEKIEAFCAMNDSFGSPNVGNVGNLKQPISPTCLRYLYHASCILSHSRGADMFVEVGGGYGGLYLAMSYLSETPIREYHIVDLDEAVSLQKLVLSDHGNVVYHSANTFGENVPDGCFFISNYCFSEISPRFQEEYISRLVSRCSHGFLAWNTIPVYDMGKHIRVEVEKPLTFSGNYFVYF